VRVARIPAEAVSVSSERNIGLAIATTRHFFRLAIQPEFKVFKDQFNRPSAHPLYFLVSARVLDDPISSATRTSF